jgi:hypothetical protein
VVYDRLRARWSSVGIRLRLAENLFRWGNRSNAIGTAGGGILRPSLTTVITVPGPEAILFSWLPNGAHSQNVFALLPTSTDSINRHLAWSAVGGLTVGLVRCRGSVRWHSAAR